MLIFAATQGNQRRLVFNLLSLFKETPGSVRVQSFSWDLKLKCLKINGLLSTFLNVHLQFLSVTDLPTLLQSY